MRPSSFWFILFSVGLASIPARAADAIPSNRLPPAGTWQAAGVPGGIAQYQPGGANNRTHVIDLTTTVPRVNSSTASTTATLTSLSNQITVSDPKDFVANEGVWIQNAVEKITVIVTAGASSSGDVTLTINGTPHVVALTAGDTTAGAAARIAAGSVGGSASRSSATVTITTYDYGTQTPTFSGGTTGATATISRAISSLQTYITAINGSTFTLNATPVTAISGVTMFHDWSGPVNAAIAAAAAEDVIYTPAGNYTQFSRVSIVKSNLTLRGAGDGTRAGRPATIIDQRSDIYVGISSSWSALGDVVGDYAAGATEITLANATAYPIGKIVEFGQDNDPSVPVMSVWVGGGSTRGLLHYARITGKVGNVITISPGLVFPLSASLHPKSRYNANGPTIKVGVEGMKLDATNRTSPYTIQWVSTWACWADRVWSYKSNGYHWYFVYGIQDEVRHCWVNLAHTVGPNNSGIKLDNCTMLRIEDNVLTDLFPAVQINQGSSGNVVAFNYNTNCPTADAHLTGYSFSDNHGANTSFTLLEGNVGEKFIADAYYSGSYNGTLLRNWFYGIDPDPNRNLDVECVRLGRFSRGWNVVGNLLGTPGYTFTVHAPTSGADYTSRYIYHFGYPNSSNDAQKNGTAQPSTGDWWADWNPTDGWTFHATLTTRTSDSAGVFTATGPYATQCLALVKTPPSTTQTIYFVVGGTRMGAVEGTTISAKSGNDVTFSSFDAVLPAQGTDVVVQFGAGGFQEYDADVAATTLLKANYNSQDAAVPAGEALAGGETVADSYLYASKPAFFGILTWPAYGPETPNFVGSAIPAGYRYSHAGEDPLSEEPSPEDLDAPAPNSIASAPPAGFCAFTVTMTTATDAGGHGVQARWRTYEVDGTTLIETTTWGSATSHGFKGPQYAGKTIKVTQQVRDDLLNTSAESSATTVTLAAVPVRGHSSRRATGTGVTP